MNIVIVGNGIAGATVARLARQRDRAARIFLISDEHPYAFSRTALMYAWMDRLPRRRLELWERESWDTLRIERIHDRVTDVDASARVVQLRRGGAVRFDRLVLALGAGPRWPEWRGLAQARAGVTTLVSWQDLERCEALTAGARAAVVVGGGLIGIEMVECLRHHRVPTTFVVREPRYFPAALDPLESSVVLEAAARHGVRVLTDDRVAEVQADAGGHVRGVVTERGQRLAADLLGVAIGVEPAVSQMAAWATAPAIGRGVLTTRGHATSLGGVWAIGDCAERGDGDTLPEQGVVDTSWYAARRAAHELVAAWHGEAPGADPVWFNSARFFELDYLTVGDAPGRHTGAAPASISLRVPGRDVVLRITHEQGTVRGFTAIGSRWDHEVLARWVEGRAPLDDVRGALDAAAFNGELTTIRGDRFVEVATGGAHEHG